MNLSSDRSASLLSAEAVGFGYDAGDLVYGNDLLDEQRQELCFYLLVALTEINAAKVSAEVRSSPELFFGGDLFEQLKKFFVFICNFFAVRRQLLHLVIEQLLVLYFADGFEEEARTCEVSLL